MATYYERGSLFRASNGSVYQLVRGFKYRDKFFFNLVNTSDGKARVSDLSRYISTYRNEVSIEELEQQYPPLTFTYVGDIKDYVLLPKSASPPSAQATTPPQERTALDDIRDFLDSIWA